MLLVMTSINFFLKILLIGQLKFAALQKSSAENDNNPTYYNIGGVLSTNDSEAHFSTTIAVSYIV